MSEHVVAVDLGVTWEPNAPDAVLITGDWVATVLALNAYFDDPDRRCVVLTWTHARLACKTPPNDEAIFGHRLWRRGLSEVLWAGVVEDSDLIASLEQQNRVHARHDPARYQGLQHHVLRLKECVVEVISEGLTVDRRSGTTLDAASASAAR
jgi:hypothetical protein